MALSGTTIISPLPTNGSPDVPAPRVRRADELRYPNLASGPSGKIRFSLESLKERSSEKLMLMFYGLKGTGKTVEMMSLTQRGHVPPGEEARLLIFTFDNKTKGIKEGMYAGDANIWVIDALQYYSNQPELAPSSGKTTIDFINWAIAEVGARFRPHFICFDGTEKFEEICDMKMRWLHTLQFSQGFAERAWWKDRTAVIRDVVYHARLVALCGVAFTAYTDKQIGSEGASTTRPDMGDNKVPRWIRVVMEETDICIECRSAYNQMRKAQAYEAYVLSAKEHLLDIAKTGDKKDVDKEKPFPWGPGLQARIQKANKKLGNVVIEYPTESDEPAEDVHILEAEPSPGAQSVYGDAAPASVTGAATAASSLSTPANAGPAKPVAVVAGSLEL